MKLTTIALALSLAVSPFITPPVYANSHTSEFTVPAKDDSGKEELIGFGTGVLIGAAIAGPVGAVVTGVFGIMMGNQVNEHEHKKELEIALMETGNDLVAARQAAQSLSDELENKNALLASQSERYQNYLDEKNAELMNIPVAMQFKTGSAKVEPVYQAYLAEVAEKLQKEPDMHIKLSGFADRRGDEAFNHKLSMQRASAVKSYLIGQGVADSQISLSAYGESQPLQTNQSYENDFFDRRVSIELINKQEEMAQNR
ncbi:sortase-associated OmpA-like protein PdsO [Flocculibacter collagenilyticus]|uniref:sortase-associated OmpA-like protein PdsO n=1 Tax=Flocculibacter collagenilyticus TaxID=2744479 RepID=UPI0018F58DF7|nr:sortase-associated OmpA-like protein PdsO [Flocculibacter collagenilyticus]